MVRRTSATVAATFTLALALAASGAAAQTIAIGYGELNSISRSELGVTFATPWTGRRWNLDWAVNWNVDAAYWRSNEQGIHDNRFLWDLGVTPSLEVGGDRTLIGYPYAELGIGGHVLSQTNVGTKYLGSSFQFGEFLGVGVQFGEQRECSVSARILHESNAGLSEPNNGLTVFELRVSYSFR